MSSGEITSIPDLRKRRMANLLNILDERIVIGDGATGTYLYELGVPMNHCLEEINLSRPEIVARVYREYADAGAQVIETNSFGANRIRLAHFGLDRHGRRTESPLRANRARGARGPDGRLCRRLRGPALAAPGGWRIHHGRAQGAFPRTNRRADRGRLRPDLPRDVHLAG